MKSLMFYIGESGTMQQDAEDDKKRSVRFADFERKSVDIRLQLSDSEEMYSVNNVYITYIH